MSGSVISFSTPLPKEVLLRAKRLCLPYVLKSQDPQIKGFHFEQLVRVLAAHGQTFDALEARPHTRGLLRLPSGAIPSLKTHILSAFRPFGAEIRESLENTFSALEERKAEKAASLAKNIYEAVRAHPLHPSNVLSFSTKSGRPTPQP